MLKLLGVAERRNGGASVRVFPCFLDGGHPLASVVGPFNAVTLQSEVITEVTLSGPGRRRPADGLGRARRRGVGNEHAGDGARPGGGAAHAGGRGGGAALDLHLEVEDAPGVLARVAHILGENGVSVKSVVQKGIGENARLVMVMHEVAEGRFRERGRRDLEARPDARSTAVDPATRGVRRLESLAATARSVSL